MAITLFTPLSPPITSIIPNSLTLSGRLNTDLELIVDSATIAALEYRCSNVLSLITKGVVKTEIEREIAAELVRAKKLQLAAFQSAIVSNKKGGGGGGGGGGVVDASVSSSSSTTAAALARKEAEKLAVEKLKDEIIRTTPSSLISTYNKV
jgi:hypothetical protein